MNKKYTIVNVNSNDSDFCIDYFFYIVIFILVIYFVIQFMSINYKDNFSNYKENFQNNNNTNNPTLNDALNITALGTSVGSSSQQPNLSLSIPNKSLASSVPDNMSVSTSVDTLNPQNLTVDQQLQLFKTQNNTLKMSKDALEDSIRKQARALFLANNFYKIDDSSFNNEVNFINDDFADIRLPESDFNNKTLISTQQDWNNLLTKASGYKNLYKPGDVVIKSSDYNISKDTICYKDYETHLSNDPSFKTKYPECMVCAVNPDADYKNTKSWKNTKTNIHKVCLFNPNAPNNSTILNYTGCKNLCNID